MKNKRTVTVHRWDASTYQVVVDDRELCVVSDFEGALPPEERAELIKDAMAAYLLTEYPATLPMFILVSISLGFLVGMLIMAVVFYG